MLDHSYSVVYPDGNIKTLSFASIVASAPKTLLYFYPKDHTPGCTLEARDFSLLSADFAKKGIAVFGVSMDHETSHAEFILDCHLSIPLITDDGTLHEEFEVIGTKNLYGKLVEGTIRSTFLLNQSAEILDEWRNVKATGHAERLLRDIR